MQYKIYQDLDGCLVNFEDGYFEYTGDKCRGVLGKDGNWVNGPGFWDKIDFVDFWANLKWMNDGRDLWKYIEKYRPEILSAPSASRTSRTGKKEWMYKNLPGVKLHLAKREQKLLYAGENKILIDDLVTTIDEWNARGCIGILHTSAENTINELKKLGL